MQVTRCVSNRNYLVAILCWCYTAYEQAYCRCFFNIPESSSANFPETNN